MHILIKLRYYTCHCFINKNNTKIFDSYLIPDEEIYLVARRIRSERKKYKYKVSRSEKSYIREIRSHKRLYKLGLFKDRTRDTDLEEPIKKSMEFIYKIVGR